MMSENEGKKEELMEEEDPEYGVNLTAEDLPFRNCPKVVYCPMCGMPPEFCEFNTKPVFQKCIPWLVENCPEVYPNLKLEDAYPKKKSKPPRPKAKFQSWPEIKQFHYVVKKMREKMPKIVFRGKVKLHGTNAAVNLSVQGKNVEIFAQSRNNFLVNGDHHGFAEFTEKNKPFFEDLLRSHPETKNIVIFGESAGKGIMKGAAICQIPRQIFAVFGVQVGQKLITSPSRIEQFFQGKKLPEEMLLIPFVTEELELDFGNIEDLKKKVDVINAVVEVIDKEDPFVKEVFGITGVGEGVVWYPISMDDDEGRIDITDYSNLVFKTKGISHSATNSQKAAQLAPDEIKSAEEFAKLFVSPARCEQGIHEVCKGKIEMSMLGQFVQWIVADVQKESKVELEANSITWQQVEETIKLKCKQWFTENIRKQVEM